MLKSRGNYYLNRVGNSYKPETSAGAGIGEFSTQFYIVKYVVIGDTNPDSILVSINK